MATPIDNIVPLTGNPLIDGLTWGAAWQFDGTAHTLSYSLSLNDTLTMQPPWTPTLTDAVRRALTAWSNVANLSFVEIDNGTIYDQSSADIAFLLTGNEMQTQMPGLVALGVPPSPSYADSIISNPDYLQPEGDVAFDNYYSGFSYLNSGGVGLTIMLHEIGHALGLKHTDNGPVGRPSFASLGISNLDSNLYTVMSYTDALGSPFGTNQTYGNAATPMPLDILAMQQIYGANMSYHTGDDGYLFGIGAPPTTIWDTEGTDTLDCGPSVFYGSSSIDLRPGNYSHIGTNTIAIAYNTIIENVSGPHYGLSIIIGNDADNIVDVRIGAYGGANTLSGGKGDDTYLIHSAQDVVIENADEGTDTVVSPTSFVLPINVENLTLGGFANLSGVGNALDNVLTGDSASNLLTGAEGNDTLIGGSGDDTLLGETTATNLSPPSGGVITGISYGINDLLQGGDGNDTLDGGIGDDTMQGGTGNDTYIVTSTPDVVTELANQGNDTVFSLVSYALPANVENLTLAGSDYLSATGNELNNRLTGNSGRNVMIGGAGNDTIDGGNDSDHLTGGAGADNMQGGEGDDLFLIDSVADFAVGEVIDGGSGSNEIRYTGTMAASLMLTPLVSNISWIRVSSIDGDWSGDAAIDVDASATAASSVMIAGNSGNNRLVGNAGDNSLYGGNGDDTLVGGGGDDLLNGNAGNDVFLIAAGSDHGSYEFIDGEGGSSGGINEIRFTSTLDGDTLTLSTHITNIQSIAISDASGAANGTLALNINAAAMSMGITLTGNAGANMLVGGSEADSLVGGSGSDTLTGGAGADTFHYSAKTDSTATAMDIVTDFGSGDTLDFAGMRGINLRPGAYQYQTSVNATIAQIQSDAVISNSLVFFSDGSNGYLYIKGSGTGADLGGSLVQLAGHTATPLTGEIIGLNRAPSISGTSNLPGIDEDALPAGIRVSSLLAGTDFLDQDSGDLQGIAVVGKGSFPVTDAGAWQYSIDGSTWADFGNVGNTQALLLDADSYIRQLPNLNVSGSANLTLRAWDQTSGIASTGSLRQTIDATANGGNTSVSSGTHTIQIAVSPMNDAPIIDVGGGTVKGPSQSSFDWGGSTSDIEVQSDGQIVLAGTVYPYFSFALARFNADGSLDKGFGTGGGGSTTGPGWEWALDAAIQQDGKIVLAGYGYENQAGDADIVVMRYNANGTLDTSFSGDGRLKTSLGSSQDLGYSIALQSDGKILLAGTKGLGAGNTGNYDFALLRYNTDGSLDSGFSGDGIVTTDFSGGNDVAQSVALLGNGKILVAGTANAAGNADFALARYNADGSLDTSFSGDGKLTTDIAGGYDYGNALAIQTDGRILLAGTTKQGTAQLALARYAADGTLDTGFSGDGIATTAFQDAYATNFGSVAVQNDGKILVSGSAYYYGSVGKPDWKDQVVARFNPDGSLDSGFGNAGVLISDTGNTFSLQPDGKILVGGDNFGLARYDNSGTADTSFGTPTFRMGGTAVVLDGTAGVFDLELAAGGAADGVYHTVGNYAGASVTLARHGGADPSDLFLPSGHLIWALNGPLILAGTMDPIGTASSNAGSLTLTFNENTTQAAINETLSSLAYVNTSDAPPASVQIDWTFSDGNTGAQGSGGTLSAVGSTILRITGPTQSGSAGNDNLVGTTAADTLLGFGGNDTLTGSLGNDTLDGGQGMDTSQYAGARSGYNIARVGAGYTVTDIHAGDGDDGVDTLVGIEQLQFADGMANLVTGPLQHVGRYASKSAFDNQHDFNGDGKADLLSTSSDGSTAISLMDGANTLAMQRIGPYAGWTAVDAKADYNGDGKADLTWQHRNGSIALWLMDGVAPTAMEVIDPHMSWSALDNQRDFNGDGKSDLLWQQADGSASIWLMDGTDTTAAKAIGRYAGWTVADTRGDYNADGKADLAWQHTDGSTVLWMMDGVNMTATQTLAPGAGWPLT